MTLNAEFRLMAHDIRCPMCQSWKPKEVYRVVGDGTFNVRCVRCEFFWKVRRVFLIDSRVVDGAE